MDTGESRINSRHAWSEEATARIETSAILIISQLAAAEGRHVISLDIGSAYLNAKMPKDDPSKLVFMAIAPLIASILTDIDPGFKKFSRPDGSIIVELDQALYGCIESALLWYKELSTFLGSTGFRPNPYEKCILNKEQAGTQTTIAVYVDDLLITSGSQEDAEAVVNALRDKYKELKVTTGKVHNYLGMVLDFSNPPCVTIRQNGMVEDIVTKAKSSTHIPTVKASPTSPCTEQLFSSSPDSPLLSEAAKAEFHSYTAKWLFVGGHGRPDLLTPISYFTKRVLNPTEEDARKLSRAIGYADSTSGIALTLRSNLPPKITTFIDASFATHPNMRSHSGVCISLGRGAYYSKSTAQKLNTTSSCEAELVALSKGMQQSLWSSYFIEEQGYPRCPITVLQDNQSTVKLVENGRPTSELSRHIRIGYFWLHDLVVKGIIRLVYCPTENMIADLMTKPLQGSLFRTMRDRVMGISPCPMTE
jgi:Reverse transcriptase (RNA-dependent DNA polymerase)